MADEPGRDLLERFVHGDRDAFELLFRQFEREAYRWILRVVRDRSSAEDALVETFWRAYRSRAHFDPSRSFGAWLRRIATHAAIDQLHATPSAGRVLFVGPARSEAREALADRGTQDPPYAAREIGDAITRAFRSLPAKLQAVAALALIEERPHAEIADALGVPIGTVKSRLFRATRFLRKELARLGVHT